MSTNLTLEHQFLVSLPDGGTSQPTLSDVLGLFAGYGLGPVDPGNDNPIIVDWDDIANTPTTLVGYRIADAYTKSQTDTVAANAASAAVAALTAGSPDSFNSFVDAYNAFLENENAAAALNASIAGKLSKTANLSDLSDPAAARLALGLGTAALANVEDLSTGGSTGPVSYADLQNKPTTLAALGVLDVYTKTAADIAATAAAQQVLAAFTAGSPDALNTFVEVYNRFLDDESAVSGLTSLVGGKVSKAANLSDLADAAAARTNLGLGSAAMRPVSDFAPAASGVPLGGSNGQVLMWSGTSFVWQNNPAASVAWNDIQNRPTTKAGFAITDMPSTAEMNTAIANALSALTSGSPAELDSFLEIYNRFLSDESALTALNTSVAGKLAKDQNLADLPDKATARFNLGLGTAALAAASAFAPSSTIGLPALTTNGKIIAIVNGAAAWVDPPASGTTLPTQANNAGKVLGTDGTNLQWVTPSGGTTLPSQTGNAGKVLGTDGTNLSWVSGGGASLPSQTGNGQKYLTTDGAGNLSWQNAVIPGGAIANNMTADTAPAGQKSSAKDFYNPSGGGYEPFRAFNGNLTDIVSSNGTGYPWWIQREWSTAQPVLNYGIRARAGNIGDAPTAWTLYGTNDGGTTLVALDTQTGVDWGTVNNNPGELKTFYLPPATPAYLGYRLNITAGKHAQYIDLAEIVFGTAFNVLNIPAVGGQSGKVLGTDGVNLLWQGQAGNVDSRYYQGIDFNEPGPFPSVSVAGGTNILAGFGGQTYLKGNNSTMYQNDGVLHMENGTETTAGAGWACFAMGYVRQLAGYKFSIKARLSVSVAPVSGGDDFCAYFGVGTNASVAAALPEGSANGIYFVLGPTVTRGNTNWYAFYADTGSGRTYVNTGVAVAATDVFTAFEIRYDGTNLLYFINGTQVASIPATLASTRWVPKAAVYKTSGATSRSIDLDYFSFEAPQRAPMRG